MTFPESMADAGCRSQSPILVGMRHDSQKDPAESHPKHCPRQDAFAVQPTTKLESRFHCPERLLQSCRPV